MKKSILFCLLLLSVTVEGQDLMQNCIRGKVVEFQSAEPMVSVIVMSLEQNTSCRTGWDGSFIFCSDDTSTEYHLFFSYVGYETQEITIAKNNNDSVLTVSLRRDSSVNLNNNHIVRFRNDNCLINDDLSLYEDGLVTQDTRIAQGTKTSDRIVSLEIRGRKKVNDTLLFDGVVFDKENKKPIAAKIFQVKELGPKRDFTIVQEPRHEYIIVRELGICDINGVFSIRVTPDMSDNNMLIAIFNEEYQTSVYILDVKL